MQLDLKIKYTSQDHEVLCFRHSVIEAISGKDIQTELYTEEIEEYTVSELGRCVVCRKEEKDEVNKMVYTKPDDDDEEELTSFVKPFIFKKQITSSMGVKPLHLHFKNTDPEVTLHHKCCDERFAVTIINAALGEIEVHNCGCDSILISPDKMEIGGIRIAVCLRDRKNG